MDTIFLGGSASTMTSTASDAAPGAAWVDDVSTLVQNRKDGSDQEYIMAPLPGFYGAIRLPRQSVRAHVRATASSNSPTRGTDVLGYMYGGIFSTVPETSRNPTIEATQTGASNQVFQIAA